MSRGLISSKDANLLQITPETAQAFLSNKDHSCCEQLKQLYVNDLTTESDWWWSLGVFATELCQSNDIHDPISGPRKIDIAGAALGWPAAFIAKLRDAVFVVDRWGTKENYDRLVQLRGPEGRQLSFYHIRDISRVQDNELALEYAQFALDNRYSRKELQKLLKEDATVAKHKKPGAGRPLSVPKGPKECVSNMLKKLAALPRTFQEAWYGERFNFTEEVTRLTATDLETVEFVQQVQELTEVVNYLVQYSLLTQQTLNYVLENVNVSVCRDAEATPTAQKVTRSKKVAPAVTPPPETVYDEEEVSEEDDIDEEFMDNEDEEEVSEEDDIDEEFDNEEDAPLPAAVEEAVVPVVTPSRPVRVAAVPAKKDMLSRLKQVRR